MRVDFEPHDLSLGDPKLSTYPLLFMHGRQSFSLTPTERKELKEYIQAGGVLIADSICASDAFIRAFREEMQAIFPDQKLERLPQDHPIFTKDYGGFDLRTVRLREPLRVAVGEALKTRSRDIEPALEGIRLGERYGVIFSPYDISCALENHASLECKGYVHDDAMKIGINAVLYALYQPGP